MNDVVEAMLWRFFRDLLGQSLLFIRHAAEPRASRAALVPDPMFWGASLLLDVLGSVFALAYVRSGVKLPSILAINIGASTPLLDERLTSTLPAIGTAG